MQPLLKVARALSAALRDTCGGGAPALAGDTLLGNTASFIGSCFDTWAAATAVKLWRMILERPLRRHG